MKKILIVLALILLSGCSLLDKFLEKDKEEVIEPTPVIQVEKVSIRDVNFKQSQAEALMRLAIDDHCDVDYTIQSVGINDDDVVGRYSYQTEGGEEVFVDVVLKDVTVSSTNHSIAFFGENYFSDDEEAGDSGIDETVFDNIGSIPSDKYDLPAEAPEYVDYFEEVLRNDSVVIFRSNIASGYISLSGEVYEGSSVKFTLLNLSQTSERLIVEANTVGPYFGDIEVEPGVYYIVMQATGYYSYYWSMIR